MKLTNEQMYQWFRIVAGEFLGASEDSFAMGPERSSTTKESLSGLKQAINDLITMSHHGSAPPSLDRRLVEAGLPRLDEMRAALRRKETGVLKRGLIRNDEEYYLVREVLSDADSNLRPKTLEKLGRLLFEYESNERKT